MSVVSYWETIATAAGAGAAVTAAAETTLLPTAASAKATLLANQFRFVGQKMKITAQGKITSLITTPGTARFKVKFGATAVFDSLAILLDTVAAHTDVCWWLDIDLSLQIVGTVAQLMGHGRWSCEDILGVPAAAPKGVLTAMLPWNSAPVLGTAFDSTATQVVDLTFTQTVATGSVTLQQYEATMTV